MKTMRDYHDLYLKCDVLILADIFEKFRNNSSKNYGLCPSHYLSEPVLSWDAMHKMTKVKLELIRDPDMYTFFEKGTRGGISYTANRYSKANNKYLNSYDPKQKSKHITYSDANYLYGYAMSKFLPTNGFKWIDPKGFDLNKYTSNSSKGCVLEVELEYPKQLRELHNDYLLAPDKMKIKIKMMSEYQLKIADLYNIPIGNVKKIVPSLFDKEKYVIHSENSQLHLRIGLKLKKVHRILEFNQSQWLEPYIEFNTQKRIEVEKNNDKKEKRNLRNRIDVKLVNNQKTI